MMMIRILALSNCSLVLNATNMDKKPTFSLQKIYSILVILHFEEWSRSSGIVVRDMTEQQTDTENFLG
jgi:hypothetical protein